MGWRLDASLFSAQCTSRIPGRVGRAGPYRAGLVTDWTPTESMAVAVCGSGPSRLICPIWTAVAGLPAADQFVEAVPAGDDDVIARLVTVPAPDADERGLDRVTSLRQAGGTGDGLP